MTRECDVSNPNISLRQSTRVEYQIGLAVKLAPQSRNGGPPHAVASLARRLGAEGLVATWLASDTSQMDALHRTLQASSGSDVGFQIDDSNHASGDPWNASCWDRLERQYAESRLSGLPTTALGVSSTGRLIGRESALAQMGIRIVVASHSAKGQNRRPKRVGDAIWQFEIAESVPALGFWRGLETRRTDWLLRRKGPGVVVLGIDLARLSHGSGRGQRQIDRLLDRVAWAQSAGVVEVASFGQIASRQASGIVGRPQRSILRAA